MTPEETADLLAAAAAFDQRTVNDDDVNAWHSALHDVGYEEALRALRAHYRTSPERAMPAHIYRQVREWAQRAEPRAEQAGDPAPACKFEGCRCTHTAPCDRGWIENPDGDSVRPCPTCRPEQARIVDASAGHSPGVDRLAGLRERGRHR